MRVVVDFDENLLIRNSTMSTSSIFNIWFEHEDVIYPNPGWSDFGAVILGWWLVTARKLLQGELQGDFPFMDGPYSLKVIRLFSSGMVQITFRGLTDVWEVELTEFVLAISEAAKRTHHVLTTLNIHHQEQAGLKTGIEYLAKYLS